MNRFGYEQEAEFGRVGRRGWFGVGVAAGAAAEMGEGE
jgi:hypothetical protein